MLLLQTKSLTYLQNDLGCSCSGAIVQVEHSFFLRNYSKHPFTYLGQRKAVNVHTAVKSPFLLSLCDNPCFNGQAEFVMQCPQTVRPF